MKARIVIGANFGDEGKGLVTDYLCQDGADYVVRFNGGAQAGHTVVTPFGERHVFRHVGSGAFHGIPTFLSEFFVCNPILFFEELAELKALGFVPEMYAHPECLVTTHVDMLVNQEKENTRAVVAGRHGSCGIGFHETITRSQMPELHITMADLWNGGAQLEAQLEELGTKYARFRCGKEFHDPVLVGKFLECCQMFATMVNPMGIGQCKNPVFEGAQGLLLDQNNKEFFPHVTHSNTGMTNVNALCDQAGIADREVYYVSRTYLTRHGAGRLPGEDASLSYKDETNRPNTFQGKIRFAPLNYSSLRERISRDAGAIKAKLVLTHCDQENPSGEWDLCSNGETRNHVARRQAAW